MKKQKRTKNLTRKKENPVSVVKPIIILIIILSVVFFILLIAQSSFSEYINNLFKKPKMFNINDECSLIFNNIVHKIKNEGDCKISCRNQCQLKNMNFYNMNFTSKSNSCNTCYCYCK